MFILSSISKRSEFWSVYHNSNIQNFWLFSFLVILLLVLPSNLTVSGVKSSR